MTWAKQKELLRKVKVYEEVLHDIQMFSEVVMDRDITSNIIRDINAWSYAHRQGNGEADNDALVLKRFERLENKEYKIK